ncbi:MAG: peptide-methionine (R)-S-oxide reductase, partial [Gorillibacterium sp.]|nr:peptide-methionine (R)-S-oxide reductase [Gorillibacterium sp.]
MKRLPLLFSLFFLLLLLSACSPVASLNADNKAGSLPNNPNTNVDYSKSELETIYLAGGCFWGLEAYM